jgi:sporulation protein YlmC with PRC-barrel domain
MDKVKHRRLQELKRSDFEIVDGEPDIRGWDVLTTDGKQLGKVKELIVDAQQKKIRYLMLDTNKNQLDLADRILLIPIGLAELNRDKDDVYLPNIQAAQLKQLPDYDEDHLDHDQEQEICSIFGRARTQPKNSMQTDPEPEFYRHDHFNDDNLYRHRLNESRPKEGLSDYEKGLRLWERRSEGGILPGSESDMGSTTSRNMSESARQQAMPVHHQREGHRENENRNSQSGKDHTIEGRIRNEGLQDADGRS